MIRNLLLHMLKVISTTLHPACNFTLITFDHVITIMYPAIGVGIYGSPQISGIGSILLIKFSMPAA